MIRIGIRAFTLPELVIGISIFTGLILAFIFSIRATTKEIDYSSDYFMSILVAQKVTEDLIEETMLNPYALDSMGVESPAGLTSGIVDGGSVHFSFLEDRAPPWGTINPGIDGILNREVAPLYDYLKDFQLRNQASRLAGQPGTAERNLLSVTTEVKWRNRADSRKYDTVCLMFSPVTEKLFDETLDAGNLLPADQALLDEETARFFFHTTAAELRNEIARINGDEKAIFELGKVHYLCRNFFRSDYYVTAMKEISDLKAGLSSESVEELYSTRVKLAAKWYDVAKTCYRLAFYLEKSFSAIMANPGGIPSGPDGIDPYSLRQCMSNFTIVYDYFVGGLVQTKLCYLKLLEPKFFSKGGKRQQQIVLRLLDIYRILGIDPSYPPGLSEYQGFIDRIRKFSEGRNPFMSRFMDDEKVLSRNPATLLAKYPNLKNIHSFLADRMPRVLEFIRAADAAK